MACSRSATQALPARWGIRTHERVIEAAVSKAHLRVRRSHRVLQHDLLAEIEWRAVHWPNLTKLREVLTDRQERAGVNGDRVVATVPTTPLE